MLFSKSRNVFRDLRVKETKKAQRASLALYNFSIRRDIFMKHKKMGEIALAEELEQSSSMLEL